MTKKAELLLTRFSSGNKDTLGVLHLLADRWGNMSESRLEFIGYTLEDERRYAKISGKTRISEGTYPIKMRESSPLADKYAEKNFPWHDKGMLWLQDVPGFTWIYMHPGNDHEDTAGCILVADKQTANINTIGRIDNSGKAYKRIYKRLTGLMDRGFEVSITIVDMVTGAD